jgi:hypothetical protein
MTSNLTSGSKLLYFFNLDTSQAGLTWTVDDGNGNSFGQIFSDSSTVIFSGHTDYLVCFALDTPVGDVGTKPTIKAHPSIGGPTGYYGFVLEVAGLVTGQTSAILDGTEVVTSWASQSTATDPAYSSTAANEFLIQFLGDNKDSLGPGSYTAPTGYTSSIKLENTSYGSGGLAWKNSTGGSEAGADWTWTGGNIGAMLVKVAFRLAGGTTHNQSATATVTSTGQLAATKAKLLAVIATVVSTGLLVASRARGLVALATATSTAALGMAVNLLRTGVSVVSSVTMSATKVKLIAVLAAVTSTPRLVRQAGKRALAAVTSTATAQTAGRYVRAMVAAATSTVSVGRGFARKLVASVTSTTAALAVKAHLLSVLAAVTSPSSLIRRIGKLAAPGVSSAATATKQLPRSARATATSAVSVSRGFARRLVASVVSTTASGAIKVRIVVATAAVTATIALRRSIGKTASVAVTSTVQAAKGLAQHIRAAVSSLIALIATRMGPDVHIPVVVIATQARTFEVATQARTVVLEVNASE